MRGFRLTVAAVALMGVGWSVGWAQGSQPDFELVVNAPAGETTISCKRGCNLAWIARGVPKEGGTLREFRFSCGGKDTTRCSSYEVGGWVAR
jgi:hypothetical protein